jgi:hypothetical protein
MALNHSLGLDARDLVNNSLFRESVEEVLSEFGIDPTKRPPPLIDLADEELDGHLIALRSKTDAKL